MAVTNERCWVSRTKGFFDPLTLEYQEVYYQHDTTDGKDTKTEVGRGSWQDDKPSYPSCGNDFKA